MPKITELNETKRNHDIRSTVSFMQIKHTYIYLYIHTRPHYISQSTGISKYRNKS